MTDNFDPATELEQIRDLRRRRRLPRYWRGRSQLDKHASQLLALHDRGASSNDIRTWLKEKQRIQVDRSTVSRWLKKAIAKRDGYLPPEKN